MPSAFLRLKQLFRAIDLVRSKITTKNPRRIISNKGHKNVYLLSQSATTEERKQEILSAIISP